MKLSTLTKILLPLSLAAAVAACSSSGDGTNGGNGSANTSSSANILDQTQGQTSNTVTGLANQFAGTPLQGFVQCLDPTVNQLLDGPDSLLSNLLRGINTGLGTQNPAAAAAALQAGGADLAKSIQSLTVNLPKALMALAGQGSCSKYTGPTSGGSTGSTGGTGLPTTGTPLDQLIALINNGGATGTPLDGLIKTLQSQGAGSGSTGPTRTPLDIILGPLTGLASGSGNNAQLLDLLGIGLTQVGSAIAQQDPKAPVISPVITLLAGTVTDLGNTLNQLESAQTATDVQTTLTDLLQNVNNLLTGPQGLLGAPATAAGQYAQVQPVNQQINGAILQVTGALGSSLLQPVAGTGGLTPTLLTALQPLTCPLMLTGNCTTTSSGSPLPLPI